MNSNRNTAAAPASTNPKEKKKRRKNLFGFLFEFSFLFFDFRLISNELSLIHKNTQAPYCILDFAFKQNLLRNLYKTLALCDQ
jgi:hypothetical protein